MTGWLIFGGYCVGVIFTTWFIGGLVAWDMSYSGSLQGDDVVIGLVMGFMLGWLWPIALPVAGIAVTVKRRGSSPFLYTPRPQRDRLAKRREQMLTARIAELEREVGVR